MNSESSGTESVSMTSSLFRGRSEMVTPSRSTALTPSTYHGRRKWVQKVSPEQPHLSHVFAAGYAACFGGALDFVGKQHRQDASKARRRTGARHLVCRSRPFPNLSRTEADELGSALGLNALLKRVHDVDDLRRGCARTRPSTILRRSSCLSRRLAAFAVVAVTA